MGFCPFCGADLPAKEEKEENTLEQENKTDGAQKKEEKS
jgi:hypothetical protein